MSEPAEAMMLKVMRLRRPASEAPRATALLDLVGGSPAAVEMPKLLLPMALTQSLVGEPFTGYLHLSNVSEARVTNVSLKVELQIGTSKFILFDNSASPVESVVPGDFFDAVVAYELRDAGTYVLTCHVSYLPAGFPSGTEPAIFKRSYRFPCLQPFAVSHRVAQLGSELLVECAVENATNSNIYLCSWRLDCVDGFEARLVQPEEDITEDLGDAMHLLKPRGAHSLVFRVTPKATSSDPISRTRNLDLVGSLALGWHVPEGLSGCVEGHQVHVRPAPSAATLDLRVAACPGRVRVEEPFRLEVEVINRSLHACEPSVVLDTRLMGVVRTHGLTQHAVGRLEPNAAARVPLDLLVASPGLHVLQGVSLVDTVSNARSEFGVLCDILAF